MPQVQGPQATPSAASQIERITTALTQSLAARAGLYDSLEENDSTVKALRNTLAGVNLGKTLVAEEAAAANADPKDPLEPTE